MSKRFAYIHIFLFGVCLCFTASTMANEPPDVKFKRIHGQEKKDVQRTREPEDDLKFAKNLIDEGKSTPDSEAAYRAVLFFEAYEIARKEILKGYEIASQAMNALAKADPLLKLQAKEKEVDMWVHLMRRAPGRSNKAKVASIAAGTNLFLIADILNDGRINHAAERSRQGVSLARTARSKTAQTVYRELNDVIAAQRKAKAREIELRKLIISEPKKAPEHVDELLILQLTEFNDADRALRYSSFAKDTKLAEIARLAARDPGSLKADQAIQLAKWYQQYNAVPSKAAQLITQARALKYYEQYLIVQEPGSMEYLEYTRAADNIRDNIFNLHEFTRRVIMGEPLPDN